MLHRENFWDKFRKIQKDMNRRFEQVDKRFEEARKDMNQRFEMLTQRIDRFMIWSFGLTVTATGLIIAIIKL